MKKKHLYLELFLSMLYLSTFTFGGGYVIVSLMKKKFCDELHYIDENEMLDFVAIAQSSPGPIAVNGAIILGYKMAGIMGVFICVLGTIIPPFVILFVISMFYEAFMSNQIIKELLSGMRIGVAALILSVVYEMLKGEMKSHMKKTVLLFILVLVLNGYFQFNVAWIILGCVVLALIDVYVKGGRK
ncbi:chromate transporter [Kandleria vitulina]|jgi:chromate transporter|uniref:Chromate transporter n=1 Tax=Kandleria vitulina TaxID=1630 RepID=A0A1H2S037_9FIRM|nr:chromate transporter [Kandleria vitulina]SDW24434.1 chromate transporter [Kandleria vitulina]